MVVAESNPAVRAMRGLAAAGFCLAGLAWAPGATIDFTPDVTAESYWQRYHVCVVRVTKADRAPAPWQWTTLELVRDLSGDGAPERRAVVGTQLWFGRDDKSRPPLEADDLLVVYYEKGKDAVIPAVKIEPPLDKSPLVKTLTAIASLRPPRGGVAQLLQAGLDEDPLVARYSLARLVEEKGELRPPPDYAASLAGRRDRRDAQPAVRVLAARLLARLQGLPAESDAEYAWLKSAVRETPGPDTRWFMPFMGRLKEFKEKRKETARFLIEVCRDASVAEHARHAARLTLLSPYVFNYRSVGAEEDDIFQFALGGLNDVDRTSRRLAADDLQQICYGLTHGTPAGKDAARRYLPVAMEALMAARERETDEYLEGYYGSAVKRLIDLRWKLKNEE